jgi:hypothetical protein
MRVTVFLLFVLMSSQMALVGAEEPIPIGEIVAHPDAYHLHLVTLQGTVRQVRAFDPYFLSSGTGCYGAYTFVLEDDSDAALMVAVLGICGRPFIRDPEVSDGDPVIVQAEIQAPGRVGRFHGLDGLPIHKHDQATDDSKVQAIARRISRVGE